MLDNPKIPRIMNGTRISDCAVTPEGACNAYTESSLFFTFL